MWTLKAVVREAGESSAMSDSEFGRAFLHCDDLSEQGRGSGSPRIAIEGNFIEATLRRTYDTD